MKKTKKLFALLLALAMIMGISTTAFAAQIVDTQKDGSASITIKNASKGETYGVVKLFDASVTGTEDGSIVYTGDIPETLKSYFEIDNGYIIAKDSSLSKEAVDAMAEWAKTVTPEATAESNGSELTFNNLKYGYYVVTSTQGAVITVNSTNPNAVVYDKNTNEPVIVKNVDDADVYIGQTVTYTATSTVYNYLGEGEGAKRVVEYEISDTLPDFLTKVKVISIVIDEDANISTTEDQTDVTTQFDNTKKITIPWVDEGGNNLYANGSLIILKYTAVVTNNAKIDSTTGNVNKVTLQPYVDDGGNKEPWEDSYEDDEVIYTYAAALQKVDENKKALAGAKFSAKGLKVTGSSGLYTVTAYDSSDDAADGDVMECDDEGQLVILGLPSDETLVLTETEAPAGYNKLVNNIELSAQKTGEEIKASKTTIYYDENGEVTDTETSTSYTKITYNEKLQKKAIIVENKKGTELPSTGGMGTTLFYIFGSILVLAAVVLLVTKKRMSDAE